MTNIFEQINIQNKESKQYVYKYLRLLPIFVPTFLEYYTLHVCRWFHKLFEQIWLKYYQLSIIYHQFSLKHC